MAHGKAAANPNDFILPDLGEGVHEAELITWRVEEGQTIEEHEILAEMETDKALVEVPSPRAGTIAKLHGRPGEILKVGNALVTFAGGADDSSEPPKNAGKQAAASNGKRVSGGVAAATQAAPTEEREDAGTVVGNMTGSLGAVSGGEGKALATPAVRRLARDLGVDINAVTGTGMAGRVTEKDVRAATQGGTTRPAPTAAGQGGAGPGAGAARAGPPGGELRRPLPPDARSTAPAPTAPQPAWAGYSGGYQQQTPPPTMPAPHHPPHPAAPAPGYGQPMYPPPPPYYAPPFYPPPFYGYYPPPAPYPHPYYSPAQPPGGGLSEGLPAAPGYMPAAWGRPVPDPAQKPAVEPGQKDARVPFRGVRRTIANRLRESVNTAVHFTVCDEADVAALDAMRRSIAEQAGTKLSFLPFVGAAMCRVLTGRFGAMNARVDEAAEEIVQFSAVHLGIATDTDSGLMVPVIRDADRMDPVTLADEIAGAARAARDRTAPREALMGSTFTISNVGSHAGKFATPVINTPEVAILAVGRVYDGVVVRDGRAMVTKLMPLSLACDHRVVDGATAALALAELVYLLQSPERLLA